MRHRFGPALAAMLALSTVCAMPDGLCGGLSPTNPNPDSATDVESDQGTAMPCLTTWLPVLPGEACRL